VRDCQRDQTELLLRQGRDLGLGLRRRRLGVREICARYGLPYNTGPLHKQFGSVVRKIVRLALPGRSRSLEADADAAAEPFEPERELTLAA
jgi:hypothetical protein